MSEKILKALMQLFAIIARPQSSDSDRRTVVEVFLRRQLNEELVKEYLGIFDDFFHEAQEKQKKTINAVIVSPASITDIFVSKGIMGIVLSMIMGIIILAMNQVFGANPLLLVGIIFLGALMASMIGLLLGTFLKDLNSLTAVFKMIGLLLYAPAFVYLFPEIPQWIGRIFPTYYLVDPLMAVSQRGEGWSDIALNIFILIGLLIILAFVLRYFMYKKVQYASS